MSKQQPNNTSYGLSQPIINEAPSPIISKRNPGVNDLRAVGTIWCNTATNTVFILSGISNNMAIWANVSAVPSGSAVSFSAFHPSDVTVNSGAVYRYGSGAVMTVEVNDGDAFFAGNGSGTPCVFTAPINGYYRFDLTAQIFSSVSGVTSLVALIIGPSNQYARHHFDTQATGGTASQASSSVTALMTLNENDQVSFAINNSSSAGTWTIQGPVTYTPSTGNAVNNNITGSLINEF